MKSKKIKFLLSILSASMALVLSSAIAVSCSCSSNTTQNNQQDNNNSEPNPESNDNNNPESNDILIEHGIDKEVKYDNNNVPTFNPNEGGLNVLNNTYNAKVLNNYSREQFKNLGYYESQVALKNNFPGWPSFYNNWNNRDSDAYNSLSLQAQQSSKSLFEVNKQWYLDILNELKTQFLKPDWIINEINNNNLKKHPAMKNMFGSFDVSYNQNAVEKQFSISSIYSGPIISGLYAPAGEIIEFVIDDNQINLIKQMKLKIRLNSVWQEFTNENANHIPLSFRLPKMDVDFELNQLIDNCSEHLNNQTIVRFGSPIGGVIALEPTTNLSYNKINNGNVNFTIKNAIEYAHYINGYTSDEEWFRLVNNTNVPVFSISGDNYAIYKPWFIKPNNNDHTLLNEAKINPPKYRASFYNNLFKMSIYATASNLGFEQNRFLYNQNLYSNDYLGAGAAVNMGGKFIAAPLEWCNNLFKTNISNPTGETNDWGFEHEINHSYERYFHPFNIHIGERINNVLSVLTNAAFADQTLYRSTQNLDSFKKDWSKTSISYLALDPHKDTNYKDNGTSLVVTSSDQFSLIYWYAGYIHSVGIKNAVDWTRQVSKFFKLAKKTPKDDCYYVEHNGYQWDYSALTLMLMSFVSGVNMNDYFVNSYALRDYGYNSTLTPTKRKFKEDYLKILPYIQKLPTYHPVANLYASGSFLPTNQEHTEFKYCGDTVRPYQVDFATETYFDIKNYTKFTNTIKINESYSFTTLKSVKLINKPKYGQVVFDTEGRYKDINFKYIPNKDAPINAMDEIILELTDSANEKNRILIRPLIYYVSNLKTDVISYNPNYSFNNQTLENIFYSNSNDNNDKKMLLKSLPSLINNNLFAQSIASGLEYKNSFSSPSVIKQRPISNNQIKWSSFVWTAPKSGWYRFNFSSKHENKQAFDYGIVSLLDQNNLTIRNNSVETIDNTKYIDNGNNGQYNKIFEQTSKPFYLEKDKQYIFDFYTVGVKKITSDKLIETLNNVSINFLGDDQNQQKVQPIQNQLFANSYQLQFNNNFNYLINNLNHFKYSDYPAIKNYYWFVENTPDFNNSYNSIRINNKYSKKAKIGSLTTFNDVELINDYSSPDSNQELINRFLGIKDNWVQFNSKNNQPTIGGFNVKLNEPISLKEINIYFKHNENNLKPQKLKLINLKDNSIIYDGYLNNWYTQKANVILNNNYLIDNFSIIFYKDIDNRSSTPQEFQQISEKSLKKLIKLAANPVELSEYVDDPNINKSIYKKFDNVYSILDQNIKVCGDWNITSWNAVYNNNQLISRYQNSSIQFSFKKDNIKSISIIGDLFKSSKVTFEVHLNDKLIGTYDNWFYEDKIATILCAIDLTQFKLFENNILTIKVIDTDINNPFSLQAIATNN